MENEIWKYTKREMALRPESVLWPDLVNLYSEVTKRELNVLKWFIIGGPNLNNIKKADDTVLIPGTQRKLGQILQNVVREN